MLVVALAARSVTVWATKEPVQLAVTPTDARTAAQFVNAAVDSPVQSLVIAGIHAGAAFMDKFGGDAGFIGAGG